MKEKRSHALSVNTKQLRDQTFRDTLNQPIKVEGRDIPDGKFTANQYVRPGPLITFPPPTLAPDIYRIQDTCAVMTEIMAAWASYG